MIDIKINKRLFQLRLLLPLVAVFFCKVDAFSVTLKNSCSSSSRLHASVVQDDNEVLTTRTAEITARLRVPLSFEDMISMTSNAIMDASKAQITRQVVRVLLPRNPSSQLLGRFYEDDANTNNYFGMLLVPPDETWQGGIMQLYRAALPTGIQIMRRLSRNIGGLPSRITEDRSVDESGVDGVGLLVSESGNSSEDKETISCFIQPLQETLEQIELVSKKQQDENSNNLVILMNPQWKTIDDALDTASKNGGFFGALASFIGGKHDTLKTLTDDLKFQSIFTIEGYICKGGNIRLLKRFDSDYAIFAENDDASAYLKVGTSKLRPTYQDVDKMMDEMGISSKYARDMGLRPKL